MTPRILISLLLAVTSYIGETQASPSGYVKIFEADSGVVASMHPETQMLNITNGSGKRPLTLVLGDVWLQDRSGQSGQRQGFRCDSPGSYFLILPDRNGRLYRIEPAISSQRGTLGFALWNFACSRGTVNGGVSNDARGDEFSASTIRGSSKSGWVYSSLIDPGTGEKFMVASTESVGYKGTLMLRVGADGGRHVVVGVPASISCQEPCKIRAQVDGATELRDARPVSGRSDMLYFSRETLPASMVAKSKQVEMEINLGKDGWRVLSFHTSELDWLRLK